jgi:hypothetical protein
LGVNKSTVAAARPAVTPMPTTMSSTRTRRRATDRQCHLADGVTTPDMIEKLSVDRAKRMKSP